MRFYSNDLRLGAPSSWLGFSWTALAVVLLAAAACGDNGSKPSAAEPVDEAKRIATLYNRSCIACHASGASGAPRTFDVAAWAPKLEKGMDVLVANTRNGFQAMPPTGLCYECSDEDYRALIDYMASPKQP